MTTWVTRQQCGLAAPDTSRLSVRSDKIVGVTKHHTGGSAPRSPHDSLRLWRDLQAQAMSGNNVNHTRYGDIEYNAGFDDFGQILVGRDNRWNGAHATSNGNLANRLTLGLAYLGDNSPTPQALAAMHAYIYVASYGIGHAAWVLGHQDWIKAGGIATACPGSVLEHTR